MFVQSIENKAVLNSQYQTIVCVTDQRECDRIIVAGKILADRLGTDLVVLNVTNPNLAQTPDSIEYLFSVAKQKSAQMVILYATDVSKSIIRYIKENKVMNVLTGVPQEGDSVISRVWGKFTHIRFFVIEQDGSIRKVAHSVRAARKLIEA